MRSLTFEQFSWGSLLLGSNLGLFLLHYIAEVCACAVLLLRNSPGVLSSYTAILVSSYYEKL